MPHNFRKNIFIAVEDMAVTIIVPCSDNYKGKFIVLYEDAYGVVQSDVKDPFELLAAYPGKLTAADLDDLCSE